VSCCARWRWLLWLPRLLALAHPQRWRKERTEFDVIIKDAGRRRSSQQDHPQPPAWLERGEGRLKLSAARCWKPQQGAANDAKGKLEAAGAVVKSNSITRCCVSGRGIAPLPVGAVRRLQTELGNLAGHGATPRRSTHKIEQEAKIWPNVCIASHRIILFSMLL